ncbi:PREDICTED: olfactory receptor 49-like [Crocodylus porosus]|uniref:Olfactory receptor n=1 Tax=Crocodylus porosus TaxID=8502 RepID=A0A7M4FJ28_CROPO|nr:PREDICTED: olfactory receptor 49-like [Crocodylus porosus]
MERRNETIVAEFILEGFSTLGNTAKLCIFLLLSLAYMTTLLGNTLIIFIVWLEQRLHTPMYFFISNLSFVEIWFTSVTSPKMLLMFISGQKTISFYGCMAQSYFYIFLGETEFALLSVMSFDRYVAVCYPLRYATIMKANFCTCLVIAAWAVGFTLASLHLVLITKLGFCGPNQINSFFCDNSPLFEISCTDTEKLKRADSIMISTLGLSTLCLTMVSYACILHSILKIPTAPEKQKAFGTCASHLTALAIAYGSCIVLYARPPGSVSLGQKKVVALFNTVVYPVLNPFIYSLRNKIVKQTLRGLSLQYCRIFSPGVPCFRTEKA